MNIECFLWVPVGTYGYLLAYVSTCWHMLASVGIGSTIGLVGAKEQQKIRFICNFQTLCRTTFKIVLPFQNPQCPMIRMKIRILFSSKMVMMTTVKKKTVFIDIVQKNNTSELSIQTFIPSIPSQLILLVFQFLFLTNHQSSFMKLPIGSNGLKTRARFFLIQVISSNLVLSNDMSSTQLVSCRIHSLIAQLFFVSVIKKLGASQQHFQIGLCHLQSIFCAMSTSKHDFSQVDRVKGAFFKAFFVLTSALLVFESVRNSLTWHLSQFWGGVGDVWQLLWDKLLAVTGKYYLDLSKLLK